ncbi:3'-5' exonuclease [Motilimonas pumila]|uniref:3'-5' exonuclease n=1 Tax=Motilimonas pumila TaxID=2303987 RepID=A0A418YHX0_9GAMM|nr:3'-5' exonuclease [Motilimonas pumila]RJG49926.1 3'-5' exonuclease [Motilimonas pumila]
MAPPWQYFHPLRRLARRRQQYCRQHDLPPALAAALSQPIPDVCDDAKALDFLALDLETTGLDPSQDHIISLGYLPVAQGNICLSQAHECLVQSAEAVKPETAVINHIVPEMLVTGTPLDEAMDALFFAMAGKVLVAHGAQLEQGFINQYLARQYGLPAAPWCWLDTLAIEKSLTVYQGQHKHGDFRLASVRQRHCLPEYASHGALIDALAAAELLLALLHTLFHDRPAKIGQLPRAQCD